MSTKICACCGQSFPPDPSGQKTYAFRHIYSSWLLLYIDCNRDQQGQCAMHSSNVLLAAALCFLIPSISFAQHQSILRVSSAAWQGLTPEEKASIQSRYLVETMGAESFGIIIDNQGVDRSTPGTTGGAALGGAVANAAYIDKAFSGNNEYSAKTHLEPVRNFVCEA